MRASLIIAVLLGSVTAASAQFSGQNNNNVFGSGSNSQSHSVSGYTTNQGTYVQPHYQTNPNSTQTDNYGTRGNYNPYNGQTGQRTPRY